MGSDAEFWSIQNETGAIGRFLSRIGAAIVFADPDFAAIASKAVANPAYQLKVVDPAESAAGFEETASSWAGRNVFLFCVANYAARAQRLRALAEAAGARFVDWPHDVFPSFVGFNDSWRRSDDDLPAPKRKFMLISTARSGSTYLAELVQKNGFGAPKEHIRKPFLELIRRREALGLDLDRFGRRLERACAQNDMFGSKVISGFLWPVLAALSEAEQDVLFSGWWTGPLVYLVRESKVEQAVSDLIANATKTWHMRSADDLAAYQTALQGVSLPFERINDRFYAYIKDELKLRAFLERAPLVKHLRYLDLVMEPQRELRQALESIDPDKAPETIVTATELIKTASSKHQELVRAFVDEVRNRGLYKDMLGDPLFAELK